MILTTTTPFYKSKASKHAIAIFFYLRWTNNESDVGKLAARIEDEVVRKKCSMKIV